MKLHRARPKRKTLSDVIAERDETIELLNRKLDQARCERDSALAELRRHRAILDAADGWVAERNALLVERSALKDVRRNIVSFLSDEQLDLCRIMRIDPVEYGMGVFRHLHENRNIINQVLHARERG